MKMYQKPLMLLSVGLLLCGSLQAQKAKKTIVSSDTVYVKNNEMPNAGYFLLVWISLTI